MSKKMRRTIVLCIILGFVASGLIVMVSWERGYPRLVMGSSVMAPTIQKSELVFIKPFDPELDELRRYEIVQFQSPIIPRLTSVMRVVGLPGEQVEIRTNAFLINGSKVPENELPPALRNQRWILEQALEYSKQQRRWTLGSSELFVVGDNLPKSLDSRAWGPLALSNVLGIAKRKAKSIQISLKPVLNRSMTLQKGRSREIDAEDQDGKKSQN